MDPRVRLLLVLLAVATACGHDRAAMRGAGSSVSAPIAGRADVGGYSVSYACAGRGSPTVILEAGYTASGLDTYGSDVMPAIAHTTRVCTYDRAGDGGSDVRPARITPLTAATQARELHALLDGIHGSPPYVLVGHSYGGMVSREFAALYPAQVVGLVLVDASSEPEIPVYERLQAGAWVDGSTTPAPNQTIDIRATVRELRRAPPLRSLPLAVITAGILEDRWLRTVPELEARAQRRLAGLSTNSVHVVDHGVGHFIPERDPNIVVAAVNAVVAAARGGGVLAGCASIFHTIPSARCLERGQLGHQQT